MNQSLSIGEVAKQAGVGVETIRFYEREGLLAEPSRRLSGYRQYAPEAVRRLRFIRRAKDLGFTLREIKELLDLQVDPDCAEVKQRAEAKLADIASKIDTLEQMRAALTKLVQSCDGRSRSASCPILDALDEERA